MEYILIFIWIAYLLETEKTARALEMMEQGLEELQVKNL